MKKKYVNPQLFVMPLELASIIAASGDAGARLPDDGYTPFESSKKDPIFGRKKKDVWN